MAGSTQDIIVLAQAEAGDALQQGEVVAAPADEHAVNRRVANKR